MLTFVMMRAKMDILKEEVFMMAQATFSVRMDENLKRQFDQMCSDFGMSVSTAITVFAKTVVRERKIPFEIAAPRTSVTREDGLNAFLALREEARRNNLQDMTLEDINAEIQRARTGSEA